MQFVMELLILFRNNFLELRNRQPFRLYSLRMGNPVVNSSYNVLTQLNPSSSSTFTEEQPNRAQLVEQFLFHYERVVWNAARKVFPRGVSVKIRRKKKRRKEQEEVEEENENNKKGLFEVKKQGEEVERAQEEYQHLSFKTIASRLLNKNIQYSTKEKYNQLN